MFFVRRGESICVPSEKPWVIDTKTSFALFGKLMVFVTMVCFSLSTGRDAVRAAKTASKQAREREKNRHGDGFLLREVNSYAVRD